MILVITAATGVALPAKSQYPRARPGEILAGLFHVQAEAKEAR